MKKIILILLLLPMLMAAQSDSAKLFKHAKDMAIESNHDSAFTLMNQYEKYDSVSSEYRLLRVYVCGHQFANYVENATLERATDTPAKYMASLSPAERNSLKAYLNSLKWYCTTCPTLKAPMSQWHADCIIVKEDTLELINKFLAL